MSTVVCGTAGVPMPRVTTYSKESTASPRPGPWAGILAPAWDSVIVASVEILLAMWFLSSAVPPEPLG
jgi:hypothetical protein